VLRACGVSDAEAQSSLRFALGRRTTEEEVDFVVEQFSRTIGKTAQQFGPVPSSSARGMG
jgi:cysteine sulfinate desulfinase/cysteine desulfurase-like protein